MCPEFRTSICHNLWLTSLYFNTIMKNAAIAAYGGALFTVIEAAIAIYIGVRQSSHHSNDTCNLSKIEQLNSDCLDDLWHHMREGVPFVFAVSMYVVSFTCCS